MTERQVPKLNEQQVDAILTESLSRNLIELDSEGKLPTDQDERLKIAQTLIGMADRAYQAGSRDEDVAAILFIAEVDMHPQVDQSQGGSTVASSMEAIPDEVLLKIEQSLVNAGEASDAQELAKVHDELVRRGLRTPAPGAAEDERKQLEDQLTVGIMRAYSLDPSEIEGTSTEALRWMVEHPEPRAQTTPAAEEDPVPVSTGETIETVRVMAPKEEPLSVPAAQESKPVTSDGISEEREKLESQVTGPMLKAFGRGRLDIPNIGDNELSFMLANPDGRVKKEDLLAARALDEDPTQGVPVSGGETGIVPTIAEQAAALAAGSVPEPEPEEPAGDAAFAPPAVEPVPAPAPAQQAPTPPVVPPPVPVMASKRDADLHFDEIVAKENFPIPQEVESPPTMPADMSKLSREEVYSLHAQFHAVEARISFIITRDEDELSDLQKLRRAHELAVEGTIPMTEDGKKLTEAQRATRVAQNEGVQAYVAKEHEVEKTIRKLKVLANIYHKDVERASRQMTRWSKEYEGG